MLNEIDKNRCLCQVLPWSRWCRDCGVVWDIPVDLMGSLGRVNGSPILVLPLLEVGKRAFLEAHPATVWRRRGDDVPIPGPVSALPYSIFSSRRFRSPARERLLSWRACFLRQI